MCLLFKCVLMTTSTTAVIAEVLTILTQTGQSVVQQIQANTPKATGKTAASVHYLVGEENNKITFQIKAAPWFKVMETGRGPTRAGAPAGSPTLVEQIKAWLGSSDQGAAYAIAKSIHNKGTKLFQEGGRLDVYSNVIDRPFIDKLSIDLLKAFARDYMDKLIISLDGNGNQEATGA